MDDLQYKTLVDRQAGNVVFVIPVRFECSSMQSLTHSLITVLFLGATK